MSDYYFEINNVKCSYNRKDKEPKVVLQIEELKIPKGEVVFIIGQSGCGKSTILETLGLMNNTMLVDGESKFDFSPTDKDPYNYLDIWNKPNRIISKIRLDYFSFIFQQTNLMRNFNIYENIAITKMLQCSNENECKKVTTNILNKIGLESFVRTENGAWSEDSKVYGKAYETSGGQQQRIAFARAMVSNYNVLFCDEPTGNLDPGTANVLMKYLRDEIKKKSNATAIIVSHDLTLAKRYGDRIIQINKNCDDESNYGIVNSKSVFLKNEDGEWNNGEKNL